MGIMNDVKDGADLTHPKASVGWGVGATVGVVLLLAVVGIATYLYRKGKSAVVGTSTSGTIENSLKGWL